MAKEPRMLSGGEWTMRPSLRGGARVCERRRAKRAAGPDNFAPATPELAPPPSTNAAMPGPLLGFESPATDGHRRTQI